jgi:hypothetical protein
MKKQNIHLVANTGTLPKQIIILIEYTDDKKKDNN